MKSPSVIDSLIPDACRCLVEANGIVTEWQNSNFVNVNGLIEFDFVDL